MSASSLPPESAWYDEHYRRVQSLDAKVREQMPPYYEVMLPELLRRIGPSTRLAELGCGRGYLLRLLAGSKRLPEENLYGVDQSQTAVEFVKGELPRAHVEVQDIYQLSLPPQSFDLVLMMETIEHLTEPGRALERVFSTVKPGGRLYLSFPNYLHLPWWLVRILAEKLNRPNWIVLQPIDQIYTVFGVKRLLRAAGFRYVTGIGSVYGTPLLYKYEPMWLTRFLNRLRLHALSFHPVLVFERPHG